MTMKIEVFAIIGTSRLGGLSTILSRFILLYKCRQKGKKAEVPKRCELYREHHGLSSALQTINQMLLDGPV